MVDVGDAAGHRIVDRDHREGGAAGAHRGEGILKRRTRQRLVARIGLIASDMRIGARLALERDFLPLAHDRLVSMARAVSKYSGVSTPSGTVSTIATSMRMPASSARSCSSFSRCSSVDGGNFTKRSSAERRNA